MYKKSLGLISLITTGLILLTLLPAANSILSPAPFTSSNLARLHGWGEWAGAAEAQAQNSYGALSLLLAGLVLMGAPWLFGRPNGLGGSKPRFAFQRILFATGSIVWLVGSSQPAVANSGNQNYIPNGQTLFAPHSCSTCHGPGVAFSGTAGYVAALLKPTAGGGGWFGHGATAAPIDTDGDGFTNGEELQDPAGTWVWNANTAYGDTQYVSNPNSAANLPPVPQITNLLGIANGQTLSGSFTVKASLRYAGLSKVVYEFKNSNGVTVHIHTANSSAATNYANNFCLRNGSSSTASTANCPAWSSVVLPNGVYSLVVTVFDKRAAGLGGARTVSLTRTNLTVNNQTSHNPTVFSDDRADNGNCTLREAIIAANTNTQVDLCLPGNPGLDTIVLQPGTYTLSLPTTSEDAAANGDLDITESLNLQINGGGSATINANDIDRVIDVLGPTTVNMTNITLTNGQINAAGGGLRISQASTMTLTNSAVSANNALSGNLIGSSGGGIYNAGVLTLRNSTVNGNSATFNGGGVFNSDTLRLINTTVTGNSTQQDGGGLANQGGVTNLYNATIAWNRADSDSSNGGAGGGLFNAGGSTLNFRNTIIANNLQGLIFTTDNDCQGTLASQGYNLIEITTGCTLSNDTSGNQTGQDPALGSLANNGGSTKTHALNTGSPAIDAGNSHGCTDNTGSILTTDQRGLIRPQNGRCDIGAFEVEVAAANTAPTVSAIINQTSLMNTPLGPLAFTIGDSQTPAANLTLSGSSSNQTLLPNANISFAGSGANRTVTLMPTSGQTGTVQVTLTVSDGLLTSSTQFNLTVYAPGQAPTYELFLPLVQK